MNTEKLAKHLKEFTFDEIEMIAECDCKTKLEHLLNANKISFEHGVYKYVEKENFDYEIFVLQNNKNTISNTNLNFTCAVNYFRENYAGRYCKTTTFRKY